MPTKANKQFNAYVREQVALANNATSEREKLVDAAEAATVAEVRGLIHLFYRLRKPELRFSPAQEQLGKATEAAVAAIEAYDAAHTTEAPKDGTPSAESREQRSA
jgi:hypothetical protein